MLRDRHGKDFPADALQLRRPFVVRGDLAGCGDCIEKPVAAVIPAHEELPEDIPALVLGQQESIGQDFNLVNSAVGNVQNALQTLALQQAVSVPQIINSIQSGDAALTSAFQKCCCDQQLATCQQTNTLQSAINGVGSKVDAKAAADQLAMCQQTYNLTDAMNRNYLALDNKIDAMESSRKDREIAAKDAEIATLKSQNFTAGVIAQNLAPVNAALAALNKEVDDIKCKLPNTINVEYPQVSVVNTTPYMGGVVYPYAQGGYGGYYGGGF